MAKFVMTKARLRQRRKAAKSPKRKGDASRRSIAGLPRTPERIKAYYQAFSQLGIKTRQMNRLARIKDAEETLTP